MFKTTLVIKPYSTMILAQAKRFGGRFHSSKNHYRSQQRQEVRPSVLVEVRKNLQSLPAKRDHRAKPLERVPHKIPAERTLRTNQLNHRFGKIWREQDLEKRNQRLSRLVVSGTHMQIGDFQEKANQGEKTARGRASC